MGLDVGAVNPPPTTTTGLAAGHVVGGLGDLGRELLLAGGGSSDAEAAALGLEVLVSAARQHLMSADPDGLTIPQVQLMAADYAALAAFGLERQLLTR